MPPKRRSAPAPAPAAKDKAPRQSALAKEHGISGSIEAEIKEAFSLFATSKTSLPASALRRALAALNVPPSSRQEYEELLSAADPEDEGEIPYANFVAVAALKFNTRGEEEQQREVEEGFDLFLRMGGSGSAVGRQRTGEEKITMATLKKVAAVMKEDVDDQVLKHMILEANGGAGIGKGVDLDEFEAVMRRAGVFR